MPAPPRRGIHSALGPDLQPLLGSDPLGSWLPVRHADVWAHPGPPTRLGFAPHCVGRLSLSQPGFHICPACSVLHLLQQALDCGSQGWHPAALGQGPISLRLLLSTLPGTGEAGCHKQKWGAPPTSSFPGLPPPTPGGSLHLLGPSGPCASCPRPAAPAPGPVPRQRLTGLDGAVHVGLGLVIHPVEAGLHCQTCQQSILIAVAVRRGDVHCAALIVQGLLRVVTVFVPALGHPQLHAGPLVHHRDGQGVQAVLATLREESTALGRRTVAHAGGAAASRWACSPHPLELGNWGGCSVPLSGTESPNAPPSTPASGCSRDGNRAVAPQIWRACQVAYPWASLF